MKNHFYLPYAGNKRQEVATIYENIKDKLDNIEYIIEPFCGSSALSYYISTKHPKKFKYILNDNNKYLIDLYKISKNKTKFNNLIKKLTKLLDPFPTKEQYLKICKTDDLISYIFKNVVKSFREGLYPDPIYGRTFSKDRFEKFLIAPINDFIKNENITFTNEDWKTSYEKYKTNEKAFIFLDPPYLSSCNDYYKNPDVNIYEYLYKNDIDNEKASVTLCLENIWIIKLLFNNKSFIEYDKKYETSKKQTTHLFIKNKNI